MARILKSSEIQFEARDEDLLKKVSQLSPEKIEEIVTTVAEIDFYTDWSEILLKFSEQLSAKVPELPEDDASSLFVILIKTLILLPDREFKENIVKALLPIKKLAEPDKVNLMEFLKRVHKTSRYYDYQNEMKSRSVGPTTLRGVGYAVDIRGVFKNTYLYDEDAVVDYEPKIAKKIPMAILKFFADDPSDVAIFKLSEKGLDRLINELLAAQKQLLKLKESLND